MKFRPGGISLEYLFRKIMPRGLFGRSLLTVLIPLILLQVVALDIFYGSHLHELSRRLAVRDLVDAGIPDCARQGDECCAGVSRGPD